MYAAARHLHSFGLAHNHLYFGSVMASDAGQAVLKNFQWAAPIGADIRVGNKSQVGDIEFDLSFSMSDPANDLTMLKVMRRWLNETASTPHGMYSYT